MMTKIKLLMLIIFYLIISASAHAAGGIALGATRIIYPADAKQTAVWIRNSHTNERFLVNSWIENSSGVKEKSFIITPPLFVSEPKSENTLRIIYTGPPLAADRESLFWMNVKEGANKQVISSQADSLIKISRIWADFFPANTSNQPI